MCRIVRRIIIHDQIWSFDQSKKYISWIMNGTQLTVGFQVILRLRITLSAIEYNYGHRDLYKNCLLVILDMIPEFHWILNSASYLTFFWRLGNFTLFINNFQFIKGYSRHNIGRICTGYIGYVNIWSDPFRFSCVELSGES